MADWYNEDWERRVKITTDNTKVANANDVLYFDLSLLDDTFWDNVKSEGGDIRVTTANGETEVAREVSGFDSTAKTGALWFKSTGLSTSSNTDFFIYYDNPSATEPAASDTYGSQNVWGSDYRAVYHINEGTGSTVNDSTSGGRNGTITGATWVDASQGKGLEFTGNQYVNFGNMLGRNNNYSISVILKVSDLSASGGFFYNGVTSGCSPSSTNYRILSDGRARARVGCGSTLYSTTALNTTNYYRVTFTFNSSNNMVVFINGVSENSGNPTGGQSLSNGNNLLGAGYSGGPITGYFRGIIERFTTFHKVLSANEELTAYNNESDNATFWSDIVYEENVLFTITTLPASHVTFNSAQLNGEVVGYDDP